MSASSARKDSYSTLMDTYIGKAAPFAQPILWHVRELMHKAVPEIEEVTKWSRPFFEYRGIILGNVAAFKEHCSFGLWGAEIAAQLRKDGLASGDSMGTFGRITTLKDLPNDKKLVAYIKQSASMIDSGVRTKSYERSPRRVAKPELEVPAELVTALKKNKAAQNAFDGFAASHRREYIRWIADAKREDTRVKRVAQTVEWLAEGKRRNWKHEDC